MHFRHYSTCTKMLTAIVTLLCLAYSANAKRRRIKIFRPKQAGVQRYDPQTVNYKAWREQLIVKKLLHTYHSAVRPIGHTVPEGPVEVLTSLYLRSINRVSEANMEFVAQFRFQQEWFDNRLRFQDRLFRNFDFVNFAHDQTIWIPDTFFQNEKSGRYHYLDQPNQFVRVRADGKIVYNRRLTLSLSCTMDLTRYPMDIQSCTIEFASYAYTTKDIRYLWHKVPIHVHKDANKDLPNFEFSRIRNDTCTSVTTTGEYSCLKLELRLERVFSFFLLALYIPSGMLVAVSWVSYWIDWKSTAARVPLAIVTLLTMITQSAAVQANLPPVSYTKALDVWVGGCVLFIFVSLIEYAVVNFTGMNEERLRYEQTKVRESDMMEQGALFERREELRGTVHRKGSNVRRKLRNLLKASDAFASMGESAQTSRKKLAPTVQYLSEGTESTTPPASSPWGSPEKIALLRQRSNRLRKTYTQNMTTEQEVPQANSSLGIIPKESPWNVLRMETIQLNSKRKVEIFRKLDSHQKSINESQDLSS